MFLRTTRASLLPNPALMPRPAPPAPGGGTKALDACDGIFDGRWCVGTGVIDLRLLVFSTHVIVSGVWCDQYNWYHWAVSW